MLESRLSSIIYDLFFNDVGQYVIISPQISNHKIKFIIAGKEIAANLIKCSHRHTNVYICTHNEYNTTISLMIDGNKYENISVSRYPCYEDEIIMSTMVKCEDSVIKKWIKYHQLLGISRFIIYDNANSKDTYYHPSTLPHDNKSNLKKVLADEIKAGIVLLIDWPYPKRYGKSGISGQTTQQNHSIYAFRKARFIGLFDVDEYVNPQGEKINLRDLFDEIVKVKNLNLDKIGGFTLGSKIFNNMDNLAIDGYNFFKVTHCSNIIINSKTKTFVRPLNINIFSVHTIVNGKKDILVNSNHLFFNHYIFLNKKDRKRNDSEHTDSSITQFLPLLT